VPSMGSVGDAYDSALAESFSASLETELLMRHRFATRTEAWRALFDYIEAFYNSHRRHSTLGYLSGGVRAARRATGGRRSRTRSGGTGPRNRRPRSLRIEFTRPVRHPGTARDLTTRAGAADGEKRRNSKTGLAQVAGVWAVRE
jgi:hypothetical protein